MYGDKAKIGLIIPSVNIAMEPEFNAMKPDGVSVHTTRVPLVAGTIENLKRMHESTGEAAELLAAAGVDIIVYGCTTGSMFNGLGWDEELLSRIEKITGIQATTTATAVIRAFRKFGVDNVALATPYSEELTRAVEKFLEDSGLKVVNTKRLSTHGVEMGRALPETTYKLACEVNTPEADAIFISCTNFKSITVIEKLEKELQKYVFSSNTATMWDVLERLNIHSQIKGYGKLLATI